MGKSKRERIDLLAEHIASRKEWGTYIDASTAVHRADVERADDFVAHLRARLKETKARPET